jgi:hypothetical protein
MTWHARILNQNGDVIESIDEHDEAEYRRRLDVWKQIKASGSRQMENGVIVADIAELGFGVTKDGQPDPLMPPPQGNRPGLRIPLEPVDRSMVRIAYWAGRAQSAHGLGAWDQTDVAIRTIAKLAGVAFE